MREYCSRNAVTDYVLLRNSGKLNLGFISITKARGLLSAPEPKIEVEPIPSIQAPTMDSESMPMKELDFSIEEMKIELDFAS